MKYETDIKQRTLEFAISVVKICAELRKNNVDFAITNQMLRSGTSIGANVREGKSSSTIKGLIWYYEIALRSANETGYWMEVICGGYEIDKEKIMALQIELSEISKILATIIINLKKKLATEKN